MIDFENVTVHIKSVKQKEWGAYRCPYCDSKDVRMGIEEMELSWDQDINPNTGEITLILLAERGELWGGWIMCSNCGEETFDETAIKVEWRA